MDRQLLLVLSFVFTVAFAAQKGYSGYQVLRTEPLSVRKASSLQNLMATTLKFDFWNDPRAGKQTDIMAAPDDLAELFNILHSLGIRYELMIKDVEEVIQAEREASVGSGRLDWDSYGNLDDIYAFLDEIAAGNSFANVVSLGTTIEGNYIKALEITKASPTAPKVFVESGIHAREWISSAVGTYIINELVNGISGAPYLDAINFYFVPMANPDGFAYTHDANGDRLWRKNKNPNTGGCAGVDLNRNWDVDWCQVGASPFECSETYCGSSVFSERESQAIRDYFLALDSDPQIALCLHSYGQKFLVPYGYALNAYPPDYNELFDFATDARDALFSVHRTDFQVEHTAQTYAAAGGSDDWYKLNGGKYVYTVELRDTGLFGFQLPAGEIRPSGEEFWAAFTNMLDNILA